MYLVCALAGQDRLNRSGSSWLLTLSSLVKSQKYFHRLLFLQLFRPAQQALGWSDSPRFRGGLSVSCSSCRGILLRLPWLRLLGESERCDHGAGPEVTPSWALRYSYISPTCWLRPPTPRFNYLSLLTTHRTLRQPGRIRFWLILKLSLKFEGVRDGLTTQRTSAEELSEKYSLAEAKCFASCELKQILCSLCKISLNKKKFQKIQEFLIRPALLTPEETEVDSPRCCFVGQVYCCMKYNSTE